MESEVIYLNDVQRIRFVPLDHTASADHVHTETIFAAKQRGRARDIAFQTGGLFSTTSTIKAYHLTEEPSPVG